MEKYLENNELKLIFENMMYENYEREDSERNVTIVDIFPKVINSEKYFDFRDFIGDDNKYSVMSPLIRSMIKIYLYDDEIYEYIEEYNDDTVNTKIMKYDKVIDVFAKEVEKSLDSKSSKCLNLYFKNLKIGIIVSDGHISYISYNNNESNNNENKELIDTIFKSEGLFLIK